jgi:hypothetical protein
VSLPDEDAKQIASLEARVGYLEARIGALLMPLMNERTFVYEQREYAYVARRPNRTWDNERAVELPIVWNEVQAARSPSKVLEVGNVLSAYYPIEHEVLDKYEQHPKVTWNEDILDFMPPAPPEVIVSISTLEHVGHSEQPRDPSKFRRAVERVISWLAPRGSLLFTVPLGYNPAVLDFLCEVPDAVTSVGYLRRTTADNVWRQTSFADAAAGVYGQPFPCANVIAVVRAVRQDTTP